MDSLGSATSARWKAANLRKKELAVFLYLLLVLELELALFLRTSFLKTAHLVSLLFSPKKPRS